MAKPEDLWLAGVDLAELLNEDGEVNQAKVHARVDDVLAGRPHWRTQVTEFDGGVRQSTKASATWGDVIDAARRR